MSNKDELRLTINHKEGNFNLKECSVRVRRLPTKWTGKVKLEPSDLNFEQFNGEIKTEDESIKHSEDKKFSPFCSLIKVEDTEINEEPMDIAWDEDQIFMSDSKSEEALKLKEEIKNKKEVLSKTPLTGSKFFVINNFESELLSKHVKSEQNDDISSNNSESYCNKCNKTTFSCNKNLNTHILYVHEKLKPFKGNDCNFTSITKPLLVRQNSMSEVNNSQDTSEINNSEEGEGDASDLDCENEANLLVNNAHSISSSDDFSSNESSENEPDNAVFSPIWNNDATGLKTFNFSGNPGFQVNIEENSTPYDFFCLFTTDEFYNLIVTETNFYAQQLYTASDRRRSRIKSWKNITVSELKTFLGLVLHMGHIVLPHLTDYWKKGSLFNLECFRSHMSKNRFFLIMRCIHFCRNDNRLHRDRLYKIAPLLDLFNRQMDTIYYPSQPLAIDESMVLWRGRLVFRQYIKNKKHKYGIKLYQLTDPTGLVLKTKVYCGILDDAGGKGHSANVVLGLMEGKLKKGHSLYMDNFYNSVLLSKILLENETHSTGTLRSNRKFNPKDVVTAKLKKGERKCQYAIDVSVTKWRDRRDVLMISTEHPDDMVEVRNRRGQVMEKPAAVVQYNNYMGGIDRKDQMMAYYPFERKTLRWYLKLGLHLIQTMILNSYNLYKKYYPQKKISYYDFRLDIVGHLLDSEPRPIVPIANVRSIQHVPDKLSNENTGKRIRKRCKMCFMTGQRKDTSYFCLRCPKKPALCLNGCFEEYHARMNL